MNIKYIQYYVEGEDEKRLIDVLKSELRVIRSGKVSTLNPVGQEIRELHLRPLQQGTLVVLVFDTDAGNIDVLKKNIDLLKSCRAVVGIVLIPQVPNLEGELVRSCDINDIKELLNSKSRTDFKRDLIRISNLAQKLEQHKFDISLFWARKPDGPYCELENQAQRVKLK